VLGPDQRMSLEFALPPEFVVIGENGMLEFHRDRQASRSPPEEHLAHAAGAEPTRKNVRSSHRDSSCGVITRSWSEFNGFPRVSASRTAVTDEQTCTRLPMAGADHAVRRHQTPQAILDAAGWTRAWT
jgi:hypothetical protein